MRRESSSSVRVSWPSIDRAEVIRILSERLAELDECLPLVRVVLFGSYARGNYTAGSDVDLLVVYRGAPREDAFAVVKRVFSDIPRLEPHLYTEGQYREAQDTIRRMVEGGVVLLCRD